MADKTTVDVLADNWGHILAGLLGLYAWMLKLALGRHYKAADEVRAKLSQIEVDISYMKGQMKERWGNYE